MGLSATQPICSGSTHQCEVGDTVTSVVLADVTMSDISKDLQRYTIGKHGEAAVIEISGSVELDGALIGASSGEAPTWHTCGAPII